MPWKIKQLKKSLDFRNPILIEGLPGMGNVGKIAVDYMIDTLDAEKVYEITSNELPHCVFVNEKNLVELPSISIYAKKIKERTFLFLAGDIQPISERSCYEFCHMILDTFTKKNLKEIVTLGGIALPQEPKDPTVHATANSEKALNRYKSVSTNLHGSIGPIVGVSGLLTGLAGQRDIPAVTLLAETFAHPNYLGVRGARKLLKVIKENLNIDLQLKDLDNEINQIENQVAKKIRKTEKLNQVMSGSKKSDALQDEGQSYIG